MLSVTHSDPPASQPFFGCHPTIEGSVITYVEVEGGGGAIKLLIPLKLFIKTFCPPPPPPLQSSHWDCTQLSYYSTGMIFHWPSKQAATTSGLAIFSVGDGDDNDNTDDNDDDNDNDDDED